MNQIKFRYILLLVIVGASPGCSWIKEKFGNSTGKTANANEKTVEKKSTANPVQDLTLDSENPKFMEISVGGSESDLKSVKWFSTCTLVANDERGKAIGSTGYLCKSPTPVTDDVYIAIFNGKIRMIVAHFSQPATNGNHRVPSVDVTNAILSKFGKPKLETTNLEALGPTNTVMSVCAERGGCKAFDFVKDGVYEAELYVSQVLTTASADGWKDGAIGIKYYDLKITPVFEKARDDWDQKKNSETAEKIGI